MYARSSGVVGTLGGVAGYASRSAQGRTRTPEGASASPPLTTSVSSGAPSSAIVAQPGACSAVVTRQRMPALRAMYASRVAGAWSSKGT